MSDKPLDEDQSKEHKMSRRNFIKFLGAAGAAMTLPSLIPLGRALGELVRPVITVIRAAR